MQGHNAVRTVAHLSYLCQLAQSGIKSNEAPCQSPCIVKVLF